MKTPTTFKDTIILHQDLPSEFGDNNVLELNITKKSVAFTKNNNLIKVPNGGSNEQEDIFLAGAAYMQVVSDTLNSDTGKADSPKPTVIHLEPGL